METSPCLLHKERDVLFLKGMAVVIASALKGPSVRAEES
jgi:hypothetical protein